MGRKWKCQGNGGFILKRSKDKHGEIKKRKPDQSGEFDIGVQELRGDDQVQGVATGQRLRRRRWLLEERRSKN